MEWMTLENNFAVLVDQHNVRNPLYFILSHGLLVSDDVVLNISPSLVAHVVLHRHHLVVYAQSDDSDSSPCARVLPCLPIFLDHVLVVSHWSLTRRTPRSPEIN